LLVGEKHLPDLDPVTDLYGHRRLHTVIVEADDGHAAHRATCLDTLRRRAGDGQIQSAFDSYHPSSPIAGGNEGTAVPQRRPLPYRGAGNDPHRNGVPARTNLRIIED